MSTIRLSPELSFPLDAVTRTLGIFGLRGSGKSTSATTFVEQGVRAGGRFVIADPTGVHWGLMHDGEGPGLPGIVFGGENADVPLEHTGGHVVAEFVVHQDEYPVVVLDLKLLRKQKRTTFMADFLETLYHDNRDALHVVFDEAHQFAPTHTREGGEVIRLLGAIEDVVSLGRSRGLGSTMISQRFATLNANVREQIETLVAHQLIGSLDRKALKGWIEANGDPAREKEVLDLIAKLATGRALVWSPAFLDFFGVVRVDKPTTFDSRATPKVGQRNKKPGPRAPVNLDLLRERMAATIEVAEANDPKLLRLRLREAQALAARATERAEYLEQALAEPTEPAEPAITPEQLEEIRGLVERIEDARQKSITSFEALQEALYPLSSSVMEALNAQARAQSMPQPPPVRRVLQHDPMSHGRERNGAQNGDGALPKPEQRVLDAVLWFESIGIVPVTRSQVAFIAGYSPASGNFSNLLSRLTKRELIDRPVGGSVSLTHDGRGLAADPGIARTTEGLQGAVFSRLKAPQARVLHVLVNVYPEALTRREIAQGAEYEPTSGNFSNILSQLHSLDLISYPTRGVAAAADLLFPTGRP